VTVQNIGLVVTGQNTPPALTVPATQSATVGNTLTFTISATDPDTGQAITLTAMNLPAGATFTPSSPVNATSGTFSWNPTVLQTGTFTVTFTATDNSNPPAQNTKTVTINVTRNLGANDWQPLVTDLPADAVRAMVVKGNTIVVGGKGIYRSTDSGQTWTKINYPLPVSGVTVMILHGNSIIMGLGDHEPVSEPEKSGVHISNDDGLTWKQTLKPTWSNGYPITRQLHSMGAYLVAEDGGFGTTPLSIRSSNNNGVSWGVVPSLNLPVGGAFLASIGSTLFTSRSGRGITYPFEKINLDTGAVTGENQSVDQLVAIGNTLYGIGTNSELISSTDLGATWQTRNRNPYILKGNGTRLFAIFTYANTRISSILWTTDGQNWTDISTGLENKFLMDMFFTDTKIFAWTLDGKIYSRPY
jgi:photosystem II stability/assembly factor-like uncharacterized protein